MEDNTLQLAEDILKNVIAEEFPFYLYVTEYNEDGSVTKLYSEKADRVLNKLINVIKKYEQQSEKAI